MTDDSKWITEFHPGSDLRGTREIPTMACLFLSYMVLGYNAYNSAIMPDSGLITDHNGYWIQCDLDQVVKPTPDQLVGGSNPTRTSSPGTAHACSWRVTWYASGGSLACAPLLWGFGPLLLGGHAGVAAFFAFLPSWLQAAAMGQSPARVVNPVPLSPGGGESGEGAGMLGGPGVGGGPQV